MKLTKKQRAAIAAARARYADDADFAQWLLGAREMNEDVAAMVPML